MTDDTVRVKRTSLEALFSDLRQLEPILGSADHAYWSKAMLALDQWLVTPAEPAAVIFHYCPLCMQSYIGRP